MRAALDVEHGNDAFPSSYRDWVATTRKQVDENLRKAVRGKEWPDAIDYFARWPAKKRAFEESIVDLGDRAGYQVIIIDLALPLLYLKYLEEMTPSERKFIPAKYRSRAFLIAVRRDIARLEASANRELAYVTSCGEQPQHLGWDGGNLEAELFMRKAAHDPGSIDVESCSVPTLTMRDCWHYTCNVRGKNVFGALVLNRTTFREDGTTISTR
jgi:hypothetical protein